MGGDQTFLDAPGGFEFLAETLLGHQPLMHHGRLQHLACGQGHFAQEFTILTAVVQLRVLAPEQDHTVGEVPGQDEQHQLSFERIHMRPHRAALLADPVSLLAAQAQHQLAVLPGQP